MNVYERIPVFEGENIVLRGVSAADAESLLKVYSDEHAAPYFNGDNCHGDDFRYTTLERMKQAIEFWLFSYAHGWFVRWAVVDKKSGEAIGTIELFHRDSERDGYGNCALLRIDLGSEYERADVITEILSLITEPTFELFYCDKIATKIKDFATERKAAAVAAGFEFTGEALVGNDGEEWYDYCILRAERKSM